MLRRLLLLCILAPAAFAHDFWIEPSTFRPTVGGMVTASLRVGQNFAGDPVPRSAQLMETFTAYDGKRSRDVVGLENQDPAGYVRIEQPGLTIVAYRSKANPLELPAPKFEQYLRDEGADDVIAARAKRGESQKAGRERFFRFAKTYVVAPGAKAAGGEKAFGWRYEIVQESPERFRVLHEGKPLAGVLVTAMHRDDPTVRYMARTDKQGRVTFEFSRTGVWLVKSVHIVPAPAGTAADWESLWASLTFER